MRLRIAALCGLLCLLASEVQSQNNQLSFTSITARPGEELTIPLSGTFVDGMSGLVVSVLFDPSVIQVLDVSTTTLSEDFTLHSSVSNGRLTIAMAAAEQITTVFPEWILDLRVRVIGAPGATELGLIGGPSLAQNAPNPFNSNTVIRFRTVVDGTMALHVYDLTGQRIRDLWTGDKAAGDHALTWDGRDDAGQEVASGVYVYRLQTGDGSDVQRKLLLLR